MRRRYRWCPKRKEMVEIDVNAPAQQRVPIVWVMPDLPGYQSPVTGLWVEGRKQRREDLKRAGCRPYEGLEQEKKEAARRRAYAEQKLDERLDRGIREIYYQMPLRHRRAVEGR